jgi:lactobin A/cerein 7B family class IIb bacteriocin
MNSTVIAGGRGVNRIEAFLDKQQVAGLREVNPAELQEVEGGLIPLLVGVAVAAAILLYSRDAY